MHESNQGTVQLCDKKELDRWYSMWSPAGNALSRTSESTGVLRAGRWLDQQHNTQGRVTDVGSFSPAGKIDQYSLDDTAAVELLIRPAIFDGVYFHGVKRMSSVDGSFPNHL